MESDEIVCTSNSRSHSFLHNSLIIYFPSIKFIIFTLNNKKIEWKLIEFPCHRCQISNCILFLLSSPNGSRRNPKSLVLLLVNARRDLGAHEHEVGPRVDGVRDEVLVLGLDLLRVLEYVLGVLLPHSAVHVVHLDLLQLLEGLELYQQHDRVDLVLMKPLEVLQVDGEHAVLVL